MLIPSEASPDQKMIKPQCKREGRSRKRGKKRRAGENFGKRSRTLVKKSNEIVQLFEADVHLAIRRKGKLTIYSNYFSASWPPRGEEAVRRLNPLLPM